MAEGGVQSSSTQKNWRMTKRMSNLPIKAQMLPMATISTIKIFKWNTATYLKLEEIKEILLHVALCALCCRHGSFGLKVVQNQLYISNMVDVPKIQKKTKRRMMEMSTKKTRFMMPRAHTNQKQIQKESCFDWAVIPTKSNPILWFLWINKIPASRNKQIQEVCSLKRSP